MNSRPKGNHRMRSMRRVSRAMKSRSNSMPDISLYPFPGMLKTFVTAIRNDQYYVAALSLKAMLEMILDD